MDADSRLSKPLQKPYNRRSVAMAPFDIDVYLERGWWVVDVPDADATIRVGTLAEVEAAVRRLVAPDQSSPELPLAITIHRSHQGRVGRYRWVATAI